MTSIIITLIVSGLGMLGMMTLKWFEVRTGKSSPMTKVSDKTNHIVRDVYHTTRRGVSYISKRNGVLLLHFISVHTVVAVRKGWSHVVDMVMSYRFSERIRDIIVGNIEHRRGGAVSFFLKQVAEEADSHLSK